MPSSKPRRRVSSRSSRTSPTDQDARPTDQDARRQLAVIRKRRLDLRREQLQAIELPAFLLDRIERMVDEKTGEAFRFHLTDPAHPWYWQREVLETLLRELRVIILKARQIGVTWIACGLALWIALTKPGTRILVYRQKEDEAIKLVRRIWQQYQGLPEHLRFGVKVLTPARGVQPTRTIQLLHPDGRISTIEGFPSTESAGHGETAAFVLMDEAAYIDALRGIWKATNSTIGMLGKIAVISTGNGRSSDDGGGNYFHRLWTTAKERLLYPLFLSWMVHPDRDQEWYETSPEVQALDPRDRKEQYPSTPEEAFALPNEAWFDEDALDYYAGEATARPIRTGEFVLDDPKNPRAARFREKRNGLIDVLALPKEEVDYAIASDVATGHGRDYSAAYVIDLSTMELAAELHGRIDADELAFQLHYLGKWFNTALIAPEVGNGWGKAVVIPLRDGRAGRPGYTRLYRHTRAGRTNMPVAKEYGFPTNEATRPTIINQLGKALRERSLPWVTPGLLDECKSFVRRAHGISPAAMDGCNDDRVLAACIALELYRQFGHHPERPKPKPATKRVYKPLGDRPRRKQKGGDPGESPLYPQAA